MRFHGFCKNRSTRRRLGAAMIGALAAGAALTATPVAAASTTTARIDHIVPLGGFAAGLTMQVSNASQLPGASVTLGGGGPTSLNQQWRTRDLGNGFVQFVAQHSGQCLTVFGGFTTPETPLVQAPCVIGRRSQQWKITLDPDDSSVSTTMVARHSGLLATLSVTDLGGAFVQRADVGNPSIQGFIFVPVS